MQDSIDVSKCATLFITDACYEIDFPIKQIEQFGNDTPFFIHLKDHYNRNIYRLSPLIQGKA